MFYFIEEYLINYLTFIIIIFLSSIIIKIRIYDLIQTIEK